MAVLSICEFALVRKAVGAKLSPILIQWLNEVNDLARTLKNDSLSQGEWQKTMDALYNRVPLADLLNFIDFEKCSFNTRFPASGESFSELLFPRVAGVPENTFFYKDIAGFQKGRSIPPHGHNHLVSSFLVVKGELHGRHFDRLNDDGDYLHIRPTIDCQFRRGEFSTVSQTKNNIHWFTASADNSFMIDFGVGGLKAAGPTLPLPNQHPLKSGRIYLDIDRGDKMPVEAGVRVHRISEKVAYDLYG